MANYQGKKYSCGKKPGNGGQEFQVKLQPVIKSITRQKDAHIFITVDNSLSMRGPKLEQVIKSIQEIVNKAPKFYRFTFRTFSDTVNTLVTKKKDYLDMGRLISDLRNCGFKTALYDAWNDTIKKIDYDLLGSQTDNVYVLIFTDGEDNNSEHDVHHVTDLVNQKFKYPNTFFTFVQAGKLSNAVGVLRSQCGHNPRVKIHTVENSAPGIRFAFETVKQEIHLAFTIHVQPDVRSSRNEEMRAFRALTGNSGILEHSTSVRTTTEREAMPRSSETLSEDYHHRSKNDYTQSWVSNISKPKNPRDKYASSGFSTASQSSASSSCSSNSSGVNFNKLVAEAGNNTTPARSPPTTLSKMLADMNIVPENHNKPSSVRSSASRPGPSTATPSPYNRISASPEDTWNTLGMSMGGTPTRPPKCNSMQSNNGDSNRNSRHNPANGYKRDEWIVRVGNLPLTTDLQDVVGVFSNIDKCTYLQSGTEQPPNTKWVHLSYGNENAREYAFLNMAGYDFDGKPASVIRY